MAKVVVFALLAIISIAQAQVKVPADGMVVKSLKIAGPQNQPAEIVLRSGGNKVVMGVKPDGSFAIGSENHPYLSVQDNMMFAHTKVLPPVVYRQLTIWQLATSCSGLLYIVKILQTVLRAGESNVR